MKNKIIIIFIILFIISFLKSPVLANNDLLDFSQELEIRDKIYKSTYNWGDQTVDFNQILPLNDGYIVVGRQRSKQGVLIKLNNDLERIWSLSFSSVLHDIIQLKNDQLLTISTHQIIKLDQRGQKQWSKRCQADFRSLELLANGKFVVAGEKRGQGYLAQFSAAGEKEWSQTYTEFNQSILKAVIQTSDGDLVATGGIINSKDWQVDSKAWIICVNNKGIKKWSKTIKRPNAWDASFSAVQETRQQELILVGADGYLVKLNQRGEKIWTRTYPGFTVNYTSIQESNNGSLIAVGQQSVGRSYGGGANDYPYLVVFDQSGDLMQEKVFKNAVEGGLKDIIKVKNGHYLAVGSAQGQSAVHNTHGFLIEFNVTDTQHKKLIKPPLNNSNFIDYQAQEITLDLDLLSLSNEVLTEVQLQPWTDYYQLKELAPLGSTWEQAGVPIILIHGFQAKAVTKNDYEQALKFVFGQLVKRIVQDSRIDANEVRVYGSIWPTKMYSIEKNARSLKEAINQNQDLKYRDDIIIIAHSMGGILARSYIEEFGGAQHVQRLITISTPHQGVPSTLVYNWTRSNFLQGMVNFLADNPLGFDFSGLRDTFATEYFYQLTTFQEQSKFEKRLSNTFLEQLNQNFAYYYDRGLYKLIAADAAGDENITFMYDLVADNYAGVQNDGLVATASALFSEEYSGIVKKASHAAITEDEDVIEAIIDDLDDLIYHLQLDSELLRKNEAIKVEIYKKIGEDKFRIFQKVVKDEQWSTANKIKELTLQGWIETTQLGLSGQNWVEIYVVDDAKERLITSYSINSSQAQ